MLNRTHSEPGRRVKQEQEEISRNHVQAFSGPSVQSLCFYSEICNLGDLARITKLTHLLLYSSPPLPSDSSIQKVDTSSRSLTHYDEVFTSSSQNIIACGSSVVLILASQEVGTFSNSLKISPLAFLLFLHNVYSDSRFIRHYWMWGPWLCQKLTSMTVKLILTDAKIGFTSVDQQGATLHHF